MKILRLILFILLSCIGFLTANAQYVFRQLNTACGLPDNETKALLWLPDGRLCVRTSSSLSLFDGCSFRSVPPMGDEGYATDYIASLSTAYVDAIQRVWLKEPGQILVFDLRTENYVKDVRGVFASLGVKDKVCNLFIDSAKDYWIATTSNKLFWVKGNAIKDGRTKAIQVRARAKYLRDVCTKDGKHWFVYSNGVVTEWDADMKKVLAKNMVWKGNVSNRDFIQFAQDKKQVWVMWNHGVATYRSTDRKWQYRYVNEKEILVSLCATPQGNAYLGVRHVGLVTFLKNGKVLAPAELHTLNKEVLKDDIQSVAWSQGNLMLGLAGKGICFYHSNFQQFPFFSLKDLGIETNGYRLNDLRDGSALLSSPNGIFAVNPLLSKSQRLPIDGLDYIRSIEDSKGRIWAGSFRQGFSMWDGVKTHHVMQGEIPAKDINYNVVRSFLEDHHHRIWVNYHGGIGVVDEQKMCIVPLKDKLLARYKVINEFLVDKEDNIWAATSQGLFVYSQKHRIIYLPKDIVDDEAVRVRLNGPCKAILIDKRGLVWVGTLNGIYVIDVKTKTAIRFGMNDGMPNEMINGIINDQYGNVWVTTPNGLCRFEPTADKRFKLMVFDGQNKLGDCKFGWMTNAHLVGKYLLFGVQDGVYAINPAHVKEMRYTGHPLFTSLFVNNQEVLAGKEFQGRVILKEALAVTKKVVLKHNENFITICFSGLNFDMPNHTYYKYRLKGVNTDWVEISPQDGVGKASYTNLSPGKYEFEVYSAGFDKEWNEKPILLEIVVEPPFYATWWAKLFYLLVFVGGVIYFYRRKMKQNRLRMEIEKDKELEEMKYRFFTNISHEFRTLLTLIITPIGSIIKRTNDGEVRSQLNDVSKNAGDLLQLVNQLLDFRKMEMNGEQLHLRSGNLDEFVKYTIAKFAPLSEQKQVRLEMNDETGGVFMCFDRDKMGKILNNLLSNAFKFTNAGGVVTVELSKCIIDSRHYVRIVVADTGCGISESDQKHVFERFFRAEKQGTTNVGSGIGLNMVGEYVKLHQGKISLESKLGKGSRFIVEIPTDLREDKEKDSEVATVSSSSPTTPVGLGGKEQTKLSKYADKVVLIVEDNDEFRNYLVKELSRRYSKVLNAEDGLKGALLAEEQNPDIVVSDVMMPRMSGTDMCRRIKENLQTSHIPVILLTAWSTDEGRAEGYKVGADAYISKPFDLDVLLSRMDNLLEKQEKRIRDFSHSISLDAKMVTVSTPDEDFLNEVIACIEKNIDNSEYTIDSLAADVVMSRMSLYRKMKSLTGQTPADFIRTVRLKMAATLLKSGKCNVSEACYRTGFASPQNFTKHFKDMFGVLPSQYN